MSLLFPDDIDSIHDLPWPISEAIVLALHFLQFEELPRDERPPRAIWLDGKELEKWWKGVDRQRKQKYGIKSDDDISDAPIDGPIEHNAAMNDLFVK